MRCSRWFVCLGALMLQAFSVFAAPDRGEPIVVPLQYVHIPGLDSLTVGRIALGTQDLLKPGAAPPFAEAVLGEKVTTRGLEVSTDYATTVVRAGRQGVRYSYFPLKLADPESFNKAATDPCLLVEYFDDGTSGASFRVGFDRQKDGEWDCAGESEPVVMTGSKTWKTAQVKLRHARFGNRKLGEVDLGLQPIESPFPSWTSVETTTTQPSGFKLPRVTGKPHFALLPFSGGERLMIFDRVSPSDKEITRLRVDKNGDRDLTNDGETTASADEGEERPGARFESVRFETSDRRATPYELDVNVSVGGEPGVLSRLFGAGSEEQAGMASLRLQGRGYEGHLELAGERRTFRFSDYNLNGCFADRYNQFEDELTSRGMTLSISGDHVEVSSPGKDEISFVLGTHLCVGDATYALDADTPNGRLTLRPIGEDAGTLVCPEGITEMDLVNLETSCVIACISPAAAIRVPPGKYVMTRLTMERKEPCGDLWRIRSSGALVAKAVNVKAGGTANLAVGEPYTPEYTGYAYHSAGGGFLIWRKKPATEAYMNFSLLGAGGEVVDSISHVAGVGTSIPLERNRPRPPKFQVVREDGEKVASGSFSYG